MRSIGIIFLAFVALIVVLKSVEAKKGQCIPYLPPLDDPARNGDYECRHCCGLYFATRYGEMENEGQICYCYTQYFTDKLNPINVVKPLIYGES